MEELLLYVISGVPGTGKSTLARCLAEEHNCFEADKFPGIYDAEGKYVKELQKESHEWNFEQLIAAMDKWRSPLVWSNTSMQRKYYQNVLDVCKQTGYAAHKINCEGILLNDGTAPISVHQVPQNIIDRMRCSYEPYVHQIQNPWHDNAPLKDIGDRLVLRLFDRDCTLICNPHGGIPKFGEMTAIPLITDKVFEWSKEGDPIVVISNQAGIATGHKSVEELLQEAKALETMFRVHLQIYCPDYEGEKALVYKKGAKEFLQINRTEPNQSFRKPNAGMIEYAMKFFPSHRYDLVEMIGNGREDYLASLAANIPFRHIHDVLYP